MQEQVISKIKKALTKLRQQNPLVVNITNYVVMNSTANALLAIGASPIMAHSREEMEEMMSVGGALVINIGTLDSKWVPRMTFAIKRANKFNKPIILDPVGCGASTLRTEASREIAKRADNLIIRGNASEIMALAGAKVEPKGVDTLDSSDLALEAARYLVGKYQCNIVISGKSDYIISADSEIELQNGHEMMPYVTGMGCSLSALTGAFAAIGETSGIAATAILGVAGEIAAEKADGPGSLQMHLLDTLYQLDKKTLAKRLKITVHK